VFLVRKVWTLAQRARDGSFYRESSRDRNRRSRGATSSLTGAETIQARKEDVALAASGGPSSKGPRSGKDSKEEPFARVARKERKEAQRGA